MSSFAEQRLMRERKTWRKDHPYGYYARPLKTQNRSLDLFNWKCGVPGKEKTLWAGSTIPVTLKFPAEYPQKPPLCYFQQAMHSLHPNVYQDGKICLSIINEGQGWKASITIKQILRGIRDLLHSPNINSPASQIAKKNYVTNRKLYQLNISKYVKNFMT